MNINTASKEELEALPGIVRAKAQAIIDGRPHSVSEDIMKVKGIKQGIFNKIKDHITVQEEVDHNRFVKSENASL